MATGELHAQLAAQPRRTSDVMLMDYRERYLASHLWGRIKTRVHSRDKGICQLCGGRGSQVHHRSYERDVLEGKNKRNANRSRIAAKLNAAGGQD